MGKGDRKTRKGKIFRGSYGNTRPQGSKGTTAPVAEKKKPAKKKRPAKKSS